MVQKINVIYLVCLISFWSLAGHVNAQNGSIDLTQFNFNEPGLHDISGEWQFYWNRLLSPVDFKNQELSGELIEVPGAWNRMRDYPALGYATYRVLLKLPERTTSLAIYFPVINSSAAIWLNGQKVAESGIANKDERFYKANLSGTVIEIPSNSTEVELIIHVVNYSYFIGGFSGIPKIGKISELLATLNKIQGIDNFFAGSLIAMFIYQIVLFCFYRKGKPYLWLSFICLGVALRAMVVHGGSFLLPNIFPSVSWEFWKKLEFISVYAMTGFFSLYIYHLFKKDALLFPVQIFVFISSAFCLTVFVTPQPLYGQLLELYNIMLVLVFLYAFYTVRKAWKSGNKDAKIIFLGVLLSFPFILAEIIKNSLFQSHPIHIMYLVELGVLAFLLFQVYLLANHYSTSFKHLEVINLNLEKIVAERTHQLMTANQVKDRLLSVVSHDIKSPLNSLRGILTIYSNGTIGTDEFKKITKLIEGDLHKTSLLVDNILHWTSSQLKGTQVKMEEFDLRDILKESTELFQTIATNKKINIINEVKENHIIRFDRNILNLTVRNLISNAIKFSHEGQDIIVRCEISLQASIVRIIDSGIGMSPEVIQSLEHSHLTNSKNGTGNEKGTGLGLSFCREYLTMAGGQLQIVSTPGKGSTLSISIPQKIRAPLIPPHQNITGDIQLLEQPG